MKTFILVILSALTFQCHSQRDQKFTKSGSCDSTELFRKLLESAIDNRGLQKYYHFGSSTGRSFLYVVSNNRIDTSSIIKIHGPKVKVVSPTEIASKRLGNYLKIENLEISKTTGTVNFYYPLEGIYCSSKLKLKDNCTWVLIESNITEH